MPNLVNTSKLEQLSSPDDEVLLTRKSKDAFVESVHSDIVAARCDSGRR